MGFTSQDDLINQITTNGKSGNFFYNKTLLNTAVAGAWTDLGVSLGLPPASTYSSGVTDLSFFPTDDTWVEGSVYHGGDVSTATKHFMQAGATVANATGSPWILMCVDQVGFVPVGNTTAANVTSIGTKTVTMAPISNTAAKVDRYANGVGLRLYLSARTSLGANAPTMQVTYTNTAGTGGKVTTAGCVSTASAVAGQIINSGSAANKYNPFLPLAAGDVGVKDIENLIWGGTAHASGTVNIHLVKPLWTLPIPANAIYTKADFLNALPSLPRIPDGACLRFILYSQAATPSGTPIMCDFDYAYGC